MGGGDCPIVAAPRPSPAGPLALARIHAAGVAWLAAVAAIAWQTVEGRAILDASPAMALAAGSLLAWAVVAALAVRTWLHAGSRPAHAHAAAA